MKNTMMNLVLASLMMPAISHAMDAQTEKVITQKMSAVSTTQGAAIKMVDKKFVIDAVNKLHGDVNVDLGSQGQIKVNNNSRAAGGVLIGSGSDGLAVVSNQNAGGPIVLQPPLEAGTSITIVGRAGKLQEDKVCATKIPMDNQGVEIPGGKDKRFDQCTQLGKALRLTGGKFSIYFGGSATIVRLKQGEKKVIPLREIFVPKQTSPLGFEIYNNTKDPGTVATYNTTLCAVGAPVKNLYESSTSMSCFEALQRLLNGEVIYYKLSYVDSGFQIRNQVGKGQWHDGDFVSLFPGVYDIEWTIDDQPDVTVVTVK